MKYLIIYIVFITTIQLSCQSEFAAKITKAYFDVHQDLRKECLAKINVDKNVEYNYEVNGDIANDENLGCFMKCIMVKENVINEAGEISIEDIKRTMQLPKNDNLDGFKEKCSQIDKSDLCQGALQLANCYLDYSQSRLPQ